MNDSNKLSLSEAINSGKINEFVAQEEARGMGPAARREVETLLKQAATTPLQELDRTSRSASRGGSTGK
jgi:hypothetical protein